MSAFGAKLPAGWATYGLLESLLLFCMPMFCCGMELSKSLSGGCPRCEPPVACLAPRVARTYVSIKRPSRKFCISALSSVCMCVCRYVLASMFVRVRVFIYDIYRCFRSLWPKLSSCKYHYCLQLGFLFILYIYIYIYIYECVHVCMCLHEFIKHVHVLM
jgi:hypothetical protein